MREDMKKILIVLSILMLVLTGCEMELPNPIIGTYILTAENDGDASFILSGFSFREDGTFAYYEIIRGSDKFVKVTGTYKPDLHSFDFVSSSGTILITADRIEWPEGDRIGQIYLGEGLNSFLFDWTCDRNNGPQGMTLVKNPYVSQENLELKYVGGPDKLAGFMGDESNDGKGVEVPEGEQGNEG